MKYLVYILCFLHVFKADAQIQVVLTPNPAFNAVISYPFANTNSPVNPTNYVAAYWTGNGQQGAWRSFFKIDLSSIPANAVIDSAYFTFYADGNSLWGINGSPNWGNQNAARICRVTSVWNTNQFNWNSQPAYTTVNAALLGQSVSTLQHYLHINAKNLIQDIISTTNNGFAFTMQNEINYYNSQIFYSSAVPGNPQGPKLTVYYSVPLPLDLLSFTGSNASESALLQWETANMKNVIDFEIEKSNDALSFAKIGSINATEKSKYIFTDDQMFARVNFYRLKIRDIDGKFSYSKNILVLNSRKLETVLFPNPVNDKLTILSVSPEFKYRIYDTYGKLVLAGNSIQKNKTIQVLSLVKGIYFINVESTDEMKTFKFVRE